VARKLRLEYAGACYHVINRGNYRRNALAPKGAAEAMKAGTDVSNGWLCERLGMGTPASVSQFVRRFRLDGGTEQAGFSAALSRLKM
jgi:hypothetical protein